MPARSKSTFRKIISIIETQVYAFISSCLTILLWYRTGIAWFKSAGVSDKIVIDSEYHGQKIMLIALYQKGILRNDLKKLLITAKALGLYVVGVNTQSLSNKEALSQYFDCYIERPNFGRDFGSYKSGFNYLYKKGCHDCPRIIMCNDSVYYESTRTPQFIADLMNSSIEVLGSTENLQFVPHLGSFCISIDGRIFRHPVFIAFWSKYRNSEIRPVVIHRGEFGLSQCLRRLASDPMQFRAFYDINLLTDRMKSHPEIIQTAFSLACDTGHYPRLVAYDVWHNFLSRYYVSSDDATKLLSEFGILPDITSMQQLFTDKYHIQDPQLHENIHAFICGHVVDAFLLGSQIHLNNELLLYLGLPLIKLDTYFRGVMTAENVLSICQRISHDEGEELKQLLLSKGYGKRTLSGWSKLLYNIGFV